MAVVGGEGWALHHEEHGTGDPILGIHGSPSAAVFWSEAAQELGRLGRVILYDRRGYLRSEITPAPPPCDLADQVADAAALLTALADSPAVVIGRSTGGLIALALAIEHPELVRALVLLEPAVLAVDDGARTWAVGVRRAVLAAADRDPSDAARAMFDHALGPQLWRGLPQEARDLFTAGSPALLAELRGHGLDLSADPFQPTDEQLASVRVPALVVSGADSARELHAVNARLVAGLPGARREVVPGGHLIDPAHPVVREFVAEVLGTQPSAGGA
ncbi:alpha/beta fold hydrolase [Nocardioides coralli]|uniref:alpha/beta fold hydrolase n=1 Tax=Nocardioides coralli TaxID=2872154 RepID=UPI001CA41715|nr:alpha/beta fold hydrolase [Nocardioides coralli]QZY27620.1 alpha/beta hydrolase [Nocardioides coralli]